LTPMSLTRKRIIELAIEVLIGLGLVAGVILYAEFGPVTWMPSVRWWGLAGMTSLLLWGVLGRYRQHWRRSSFWLHIAWLTAIHLAAWSILLVRVSEWGLLWFI